MRKNALERNGEDAPASVSILSENEIDLREKSFSDEIKCEKKVKGRMKTSVQRKTLLVMLHSCGWDQTSVGGRIVGQAMVGSFAVFAILFSAKKDQRDYRKNLPGSTPESNEKKTHDLVEKKEGGRTEPACDRRPTIPSMQKKPV